MCEVDFDAWNLEFEQEYEALKLQERGYINSVTNVCDQSEHRSDEGEGITHGQITTSYAPYIRKKKFSNSKPTKSVLNLSTDVVLTTSQKASDVENATVSVMTSR